MTFTRLLWDVLVRGYSLMELERLQRALTRPEDVEKREAVELELERRREAPVDDEE